MKILHVIHSISPTLGGPTQAVLSLVKALRDQRVDAEIVTTNDNGKGVLDVPVGERVVYEGVPVRFFQRSLVKHREYIFSLGLTRWLWKHIHEYDLVFINYLFTYTSTAGAWIARHKKVPYIIRTIGQLSPEALNQSKWKKDLYTWLFERKNLKQAQAIHCASMGEAEDVARFGVKKQILQIPIGVQSPSRISEAKEKLHKRYNIPDGKPVVLFLGRIHPTKRPELIFQALEELLRKNLDFHLLMAGPGEVKTLEKLKEMVASLDLKPYVTFTGFVEGQDKDLLLQGADVFVLPSRFESFGIALAEAMVIGLPVVVTREVKIAETVAQANAGLVIEGNVDSLAQAIEKLLASPELRRTLGENGKCFAHDNYNWSKIAGRFITAFEDILSRSRK